MALILKASIAYNRLTPSEIARGNGIGFIPYAVDQASSHIGKVLQKIKKTKQSKGLNDKNWSPGHQ